MKPTPGNDLKGSPRGLDFTVPKDTLQALKEEKQSTVQHSCDVYQL